VVAWPSGIAARQYTALPDRHGSLRPLPLVNVIPGAIIVLIAIAYLQEDRLLLAVAAAAAFLSLAGFGWTLWTSGGAVMRWIGIRRRPRTAAPMRSPLPSSRKGRS
jgi:hypothetical protein